MKTAEVTVDKINVGDKIVHDSGEIICVEIKAVIDSTGSVSLGGTCPVTISPNGQWSATYNDPHWIEKVLIENE